MQKLIRLLLLFVRDIPTCALRAMVKAVPVECFGNKIRFYYYRSQFYHLGSGTRIGEGCEIYEPQLISVGKDSSIGRYSELNAGPSVHQPCLIIGDGTWLGPYCLIRTNNHRFDDPNRPFIEQGHNLEEKVIIGNDVYAGAHCIFLPGTQIGNHCVIAAGSVVSGVIPDYSIVAGNPARVVKKRL